jgi:hypothetical protein
MVIYAFWEMEIINIEKIASLTLLEDFFNAIVRSIIILFISSNEINYTNKILKSNPN